MTRRKATGWLNIAADDVIKLSDVIGRAKAYKVLVPYRLAKLAVKIAWGLCMKVQDYPPGFIDYIYFPWVLDNS